MVVLVFTLDGGDDVPVKRIRGDACAYHSRCRVPVDDRTPVDDTVDDLTLRGGRGSGFLQSRTRPRADHVAVSYRIDLTRISGGPCLRSMTIDAPRPEMVFVGTDGLGVVGPTAARWAEGTLDLDLDVCPGESSYFFGYVTDRGIAATHAEIVDENGRRYVVRARGAR